MVYKHSKKKFKKTTFFYIMIALAVVLMALFAILIVRSMGRRLSGRRDFVIPEFSGDPYVEINGNVPFFTDDDLKR